MKFIKMITLLVLNYNDYENVVSFISAVYNFELFQYIVVVDNCSTDNSFEAIQFYINQKRINQKVHLIKTNKNGGYGFGNNIGLKYAINILKSQYIVVSNPDVEFEEEIILKLKKNLEENREFGVAAAAMYNTEEKKMYNTATPIPSKLNYFFSPEMFFAKVGNGCFYKNITCWKEDRKEVDCVSGSMLMVKAEAMEKCGFYDEELFLYGEELTLGMRMRNVGYKTILLNNEKFIHHNSLSISKVYKKNIQKKKLQINSYYTILKKYYNCGKITIFFSKLIGQLSLFETFLWNKVKYR